MVKRLQRLLQCAIAILIFPVVANSQYVADELDDPLEKEVWEYVVKPCYLALIQELRRRGMLDRNTNPDLPPYFEDLTDDILVEVIAQRDPLTTGLTIAKYQWEIIEALLSEPPEYRFILYPQLLEHCLSEELGPLN